MIVYCAARHGQPTVKIIFQLSTTTHRNPLLVRVYSSSNSRLSRQTGNSCLNTGTARGADTGKSLQLPPLKALCLA